LKIFLSFLQGQPGYPIPPYSHWEYYTKNGIEEGGYTWIETDIDWAYGLIHQTKESLSEWKSVAWEKTVTFIKKNKPDLFLSYLYPHQVDTSAINEIKKMGVPTVNFFCDNIREFKKVPLEYKVFDLNWVPEYKALPLYKKAKYNYVHLPMPMWVHPVQRDLPLKESAKVSFIGSQDIQRLLLFEKVFQNEILFDLNIYGAGWKEDIKQTYNTVHIQQTIGEKLLNQFQYINKHGINSYYRKLKQRNLYLPVSQNLSKCVKAKISFDQYIEITKSSSITLGINRYPSFRFPLHKPNTYSRLRDIEAPMLGACYLTEYTEGIENMYDLENEIKVYSSAAELIENVEMLLKDKHLRTKMRKQSQQRALNLHSIPNSIKQIQEYFNIR
jgi:hypothetical protein